MLTDEEEVDEEDDEEVRDVPSPLSIMVRDKFGSKKIPLKTQHVRHYEDRNWSEESMDQQN